MAVAMKTGGKLDSMYYGFRMVVASAGYMLKSPFIDLKRIENIKIKCKK